MPSHLFRRWLAAALATLGLIALIAMPSTAAARGRCANAHTRVGRISGRAVKRAVVCLINEQRTSRGLPALHSNRRLNRSAQRWTDTMVHRDKFTHGRNFAARISAVGYDWSIAGENIAVGYKTPSGVVRAWMASKGHCENILDPDFAQIGTGVLDHGIAGWAGAGTWTQDFGLWMGHRVPSHRWGPADRCPH